MRALPLLSAFVLLALCCSGQVIGTDPLLPWATLGEPYSLSLTVSGGTPPYAWTVSSGALPPGMNLAASGLLSGSPSQSGSYYFTALVTDGSGHSASRAFSLVVILPTTPTFSVVGLADKLSPATQPEFGIQLSPAYPRDIEGAVTLTFEPEAVNEADDPTIRFANGSRTLNFTVPAGQTTVSWSSAPVLQTGTVAGKIKLRLQFSSGGQNLTPLVPPVRSVTVARVEPVIQSVEVVKVSGGFKLLVSAYSTPREITYSDFTFAYTKGSDTRITYVTVPLNTAFTTWYTSDASVPYGSAFLYTQPFTVESNSATITEVSVTLSNSSGTSDAVSATF